MVQKNKMICLLFYICSFNFSVDAVAKDLVSNRVNVSTPKATGKQVFYFGEKIKKSKEAIVLNKPLSYDSATGYGFDFNTATNVKLNSDSFSNTAPTYFSVKLPEGNYQVSVTFGSKIQNTNTTIKAESRRLMLDQQPLKKGQIVTKTFNINVRTPKIDDKTQIQLKDRDLGQLNWDEKLTLEFLGTVEVKSISITPIDNVVNVYLAGDSTVTDQDLEPWASWGQFITNYFDQNVVVSNYAVSGATLRSFKSSLRLKKVLSIIKPGDYLIVEFAHNDEKEKGEGIGPWDSYSASIREFVQAARDKGANPILITPVQRRAFNTDGTLKSTHGDYPDAMRKVAQEMNVPLVDITKLTTTLYESWGDEPSRKAFVQYPANTFSGQKEKLEDNTHFNSFGANEIALCIMKGLRDLNNPLAKYLIKDLPQYNPNQPNAFAKWTLPMSNRFEIVKPDGN
ncbi:Lysophospholipase L1 [Flavobacterium glycines]|uniref:Lysophospholipase L1 n=1 Tax=Flavobacterium glycines TaxID=551990 RepID=A0A511CE31_9FLAO|nr:rhamnogalacturonan acetylesterase [Flavobacterium glycines]GEL10799.1 rhamnogalacturonan acetylesterase [Flavobacterium glycines]SDI53863.1 Lysophospholipase L1 [Flavobacterium glycines]